MLVFDFPNLSDPIFFHGSFDLEAGIFKLSINDVLNVIL